MQRMRDEWGTWWSTSCYVTHDAQGTRDEDHTLVSSKTRAWPRGAGGGEMAKETAQGSKGTVGLSPRIHMVS
jgi:hypothetical protein